MNTEVTDGFSNADWDLYARCYDALLQLRPYQELLFAVASALKLEDGDIVLDAGSGTGNLLHYISERKERVSLSGADLSPEMMARARSKCAHDGVIFTAADLNKKLPYSDCTFTKISSMNVLYAVKDPASTLRELVRVLKQNGTITLVMPKKEYDNGLILKSHAQSIKPDAYWKQLHLSVEREEMLVREAIADHNVVEMMLLIARYNRFIAKTATFHFLTKEELVTLVSSAGLAFTGYKDVYADQCMLITAQKE